MCLRIFGSSAARVVSAEIRFHLRRLNGGSTHDTGRYRSDWTREEGFTEGFETAYSDLKLLRSLPGGCIEGIKIMTELCPVQIDVANHMDFGYQGQLDAAGGADFEGVTALRELFKLSHEDRRAWNLKATFKAMRKERNERAWLSEAGRSEKQEYDDCPVWAMSLELLRSWHTRETGAMLAMKVSGYVLPPELVEYVAEYFHGEGEMDHRIPGSYQKWWMDPEGKMTADWRPSRKIWPPKTKKTPK